MANVGAGKTTYVGSKLAEDLDYEGFYIVLLPYTALLNQTLEATNRIGELQPITPLYKLLLQGFEVFHADTTLADLEKTRNKKVAMTLQSFMWFAQSNPDIWQRIGVLVLDEVDHALITLPSWPSGRPNDPVRNIQSILQANMRDMYLIGISATGHDRLQKSWGDYINLVQFTDELREIQVAPIQYYTALNGALAKIPSTEKTAIYLRSVRECVRQKDYLQSLGKKVDLLVSDTAKNYRMSARELALKQSIATYGTGDFGDILIFNGALERGISIIDKRFTHVFVHNSNPDVQTQVIGRFRLDGIQPHVLRSKQQREGAIMQNQGIKTEIEQIQLPNEYLNTPLTTKDKARLVEHLSWINAKDGTAAKWTLVKRKLEEYYAVEDTRVVIDGKRTRVSVIKTIRPTT